MKRGEGRDKSRIKRILKDINSLQQWFEEDGIKSAKELEKNKLIQLATTQTITYIYRHRAKLSHNTLSKLVEFDKIQLDEIYFAANHSYDDVDFKEVYDACNEKLFSTCVTGELEREMQKLSSSIISVEELLNAAMIYEQNREKQKLNPRAITIDKLKDIVSNIAPKYPLVTKIGVFGSYARGDNDEKSDIDILYDYEFDEDDSTDQLLGFVEEFSDAIEAIEPIEVDFVWAQKLDKDDDGFCENVFSELIWIYDTADKSSDDNLTDEDLGDIKTSSEEYSHDEFVGHEDVDWDDDELSEEDLEYIRISREALARGEYVTHSEVFSDIATSELIKNHEIAMGEYERGETIDHEDVDWD